MGFIGQGLGSGRLLLDLLLNTILLVIQELSFLSKNRLIMLIGKSDAVRATVVELNFLS